MLRRALPGIVASTLVAGPVLAQTVDELVAKSVAARGGLARLRAVTSLRMSGTVSMGGMDLPLVVEVKRPSSMRQEVTYQGSLVVDAFDGKHAWAIPPMGEGPVALPAVAAKQKAEQADLEGPLVDYQAKGITIELVGREKLDSGDAFKLKVSRKGEDAQFYFLSAKSYLTVRVEARAEVMGRQIETESTIGDYREVGGVLWAHSIQNAAQGQPEKQNVTFTKIEVNPPIADSRFKMPADAKPFRLRQQD